MRRKKRILYAENVDKMELRQLGVEWIRPIVAFDRYCFPADFWKEADWQELLGDARAKYYALMENGEIIANVFCYDWAGEKDYLKIMNIAVHPAYRGKGLARKLLNYAAAECAGSGLRRICGETRESNRAMQKVFENCGYELKQVEKGYYQNPNESAYKYVLQMH